MSIFRNLKALHIIHILIQPRKTRANVPFSLCIQYSTKIALRKPPCVLGISSSCSNTIMCSHYKVYTTKMWSDAKKEIEDKRDDQRLSHDYAATRLESQTLFTVKIRSFQFSPLDRRDINLMKILVVRIRFVIVITPASTSLIRTFLVVLLLLS